MANEMKDVRRAFEPRSHLATVVLVAFGAGAAWWLSAALTVTALAQTADADSAHTVKPAASDPAEGQRGDVSSHETAEPSLSAGDAAAPGSAGVSLRPERFFLAPDGRIADADQAYRRRFELAKPDPWWPLIGQLAGLTAGTVVYWLFPSPNERDWDFSDPAEHFRWSAFRFDDNPFATNWVMHVFTGAGAYLVGRAHDLSIPIAWLYAFAASTFWEVFLEFREVISVNDLIVTPMGGLAMGDFFLHLGRYVNSALRPTAWHHAAGWIFGAPVALHRLTAQTEIPEAWSNDAGFGTSIWHRLSLGAGPAYKTKGRWAGEFSFDGELVALPSFLRVGRDRRFFSDGDFTRLDARLSLGAGGGGGRLDSDAVLVGYFDQTIERAEHGLEGRSFAIGMNASFMLRSEDYEQWTERYALVGLPGLAIELGVLQGHAVFRLGLRGNAVFGGAYAPSFGAWRLAHPEEQPTSSLLSFDYYLGWGLWGGLRAALRWPVAEFSLRLNGSLLDSIEGLDRHQDEITADLSAKDLRGDSTFQLKLFPFTFGFFVALEVSGQWRATWLEGSRERGSLVSTSLLLGFGH